MSKIGWDFTWASWVADARDPQRFFIKLKIAGASKLPPVSNCRDVQGRVHLSRDLPSLSRFFNPSRNIARIAKGLRISASPRSGDRERDDGSALTSAAR